MADNPYFPTAGSPAGFAKPPATPEVPKPYFPEPKKESNFWHGLTYGATGYKPHVDADEETFGRIVGEIGGFIVANTLLKHPVGAATSKLAGLKFLKPVVGAKRTVSLWGNKKGQALIQKLGYSPERARYLARTAGSDMKMEMAFQGGKLGIGYGSGTEDAPLHHKLGEVALIGALTPVGTLGVDKIGRGVKRWYKKKYKPEEVNAENQLGRVVKPDDAESPIEFPKGDKDADVVKQIHDQEFVRAQMDWMKDVAQGILKKAGLKTEPDPPMRPPDNDFAPSDDKPWRTTRAYQKTIEANQIDHDALDDLARILRSALIGRSSNLRADLNKWVKANRLTPKQRDALLREFSIQFNTVSTANHKFQLAYDEVWDKLPKELWEDLDAYSVARVTRDVIERKRQEVLDELDRVIAEGEGMVSQIGMAQKGGHTARITQLQKDMAQIAQRRSELEQSLEIEDWKPASMLSEDEIDELIKAVDGRAAGGEASARAVKEAADSLFGFMKREVTQLYYDVGMISQKEYEVLMQNDYLPREFLHLLDEGLFRSKVSPDAQFSGTPKSKPMDIGRGSTQPQRVNAQLLLRQAIGRAESAAQKQRIGLQLADIAFEDPANGLVKIARIKLPEIDPADLEPGSPNASWKQPTPKNVEEAFEQIPEDANWVGANEVGRATYDVTLRNMYGEVRKVKLSLDRDLARDLADPNPWLSRSAAQALRHLSGSHVLKQAVVGWQPLFGAIINPLLDLGSQFMKDNTYRSLWLHKWIGQTAEDLAVVMKDAKLKKGIWYEAFARNGGPVSNLYLNDAGHGMATRIEDWIEEAAGPKSKPRRTFKDRSFRKQLERWATVATRSSEIALRLGYFRRVMKSQLAKLEAEGIEIPPIEEILKSRDPKWNRLVRQAVYEATDYVNFGDDAGLVRLFDAWTPFLQAHVNVVRPQMRAWANHKGRQLVKIMQPMLFGIMLWNVNRAWAGNEQQKIPAHHKANYYPVMLPIPAETKNGKRSWYYLKIPKESGSAPFINIGQMLAQKLVTGEGPSEGWLKRLSESMATYSDLSPIDVETGINFRFFTPPIAQAALAYFSNRDVWWNQDIWSSTKRVAPEQEIKENTSTLAIDIGKATGLSPARMEVAFQKLFGNQNPFLDALGMGYKYISTQISDNPVEQATFQQEITRNIPIFKRLIGKTPAYSSQVFEVTRGTSEEVATKREQANAALQNRLEGLEMGIYNKQDVVQFVQQFDQEEQKRLMRKVNYWEKTHNLIHYSILKSLAEVSPKERPRAAYQIYKILPLEDRASFLAEMKLYPSLITRPNFWDEFNAAEAMDSGRGLERDATPGAVPPQPLVDYPVIT